LVSRSWRIFTEGIFHNVTHYVSHCQEAGPTLMGYPRHC
jgi:hypothetical protein